MGKIIVSTSWDDGNMLDYKLVSLLEKYNLSGTFYPCKSTTRFDDRMIKDIFLKYEVGAHTLTHSKLTEISINKAAEEIKKSKNWLEGIFEKEVNMFCYPYGLYDDQIKEAVEKVGFTGARTTDNFRFDVGGDLFSIPVTLQVFPFPVFPSKNHGYKFMVYRNLEYFRNIKRLKLSPLSMVSWSKLATASFDYAEQHSGVWHIWGHSWEIERYNMWEDLETVFRYVANRPNCKYVNNSFLAAMIKPYQLNNN